MPEPKDKSLYNSVKSRVYNKMPQHSAYRSGHLVREYKEAYKKKHNSSSAYTGSKKGSNLGRWYSEKWRNQRGEVGYSKSGDVYRPTIKVSSKTPKTYNELSSSRIQEARNQKKLFGRVKKF